MYTQYVKLCNDHALDIGKLWLYKGSDRWVLNFPTKKHWKFPSKEVYLRQGLEKFVQFYTEKGIHSIAFPLLGAQHGGLDPEQSLGLMQHYLGRCEIPIEIYKYDPDAADDVYDSFKAVLQSRSVDELKRATGLRSNYIELLKEAVELPNIHQLNQLGAVKGIGDKTLEAAFAYMRKCDSSVGACGQREFAL